MNIVLIGMRGSGKSTIARKLSKKLGKPYVEIDKLIAKRFETTIPAMVAAHGWEYFREKESEITKEVSAMDNVIISTGGGVVLRAENSMALQKSGKLFYLRCTIATLLKRIGHDKSRPALTGQSSLEEEMKEVYNTRKTLYESAATRIIDTERKSIKQIVEEIINALDLSS